MPPKKNPLKLNKLQLRTLALAQVLAADDALVQRDEASGDVTLLHVPQPHGDHVHVGQAVVSARDMSGMGNPAVWTALGRKGLARPGDPNAPIIITLTTEGLAYDTGFGERLAAPSDH